MGTLIKMSDGDEICAESSYDEMVTAVGAVGRLGRHSAGMAVPAPTSMAGSSRTASWPWTPAAATRS